MDTIGTREAKDIIYMNDGIKVRNIICRITKNGDYVIFRNGVEIFRTSKINIALDWMVDAGYMHETRFRLTAYQKDILRQRIWEYIGCTIMGGIITGIGLIMLIAWLLGIGC